jgi:HEAT repeats
MFSTSQLARTDFGQFALRPHYLALILILGAPCALRGQEPAVVQSREAPKPNPPSESASSLVEQFNTETVFWKQFEVAEKIVALRDNTVLHDLEPWLSNPDMHMRGNAAFIFGRLGDGRGFEVIRAILEDRSTKRTVDLRDDAGHPSPELQIRQDRYYAVHLFGDLKDPRAVPILVPLLSDDQVNWIVPWALGEIGDKSAIPPLITALSDSSPDMRVLAIDALGQLDAKEALPRLRTLLDDNEKIHFDGLGTVAEAAKKAIAKLEAPPR